MVSSKFVFNGGGFIFLLALISLSNPASLSQSPHIEHSFITDGSPRIVISKASAISIASWDRNEVSIAAKTSGAALRDEEVRVKLNKDKMEVSVHPSHKDERISLALRVPPNSRIEIKTHDSKIHIEQPADPIRVMATEGLIHLDVPESAALDLRGIERAMMYKQIGYSTRGVPIGRRQVGQGPPFLKVNSTGARVIVSHGPIMPFVRPLTFAAEAIARRGGSMGEAIRKTYPRLIKANPNDKEPSGVRVKTDRDDDAFKLETHLVNMNVSVTDRDGKAFAGLKQEDFSVYEDGVLQRISFFSPEQSPFNLVLLIDLSGSVKNKIDLIRETALHFLDVINPEDSVAIITFTDDVTVVSRLTKEREELREKIGYIRRAGGATSFYDALGYALVEELSRAKGQRNAVIAITDGQDNSIPLTLAQAQRPMSPGAVSYRVGSFLTFEQLLEGASEAEALIYTIHLEGTGPVINTMSSPGAPVNSMPPSNIYNAETAETAERQLRELADVSGARMYRAKRIEDLKGVFEEVAAELRTIYSLAYSPINLDFDGRFRRVQVRVNAPDAAIRARRGYYAK